MLVRIYTPKFTAGFITDGKVTRAAPLLRFLLGKTDDEVRAIVSKNKWKASIVEDYSIYDEASCVWDQSAAAKPAYEHSEYTCNYQGCGKVAPFGIGVSVLHGISGIWLCFEHWKERTSDSFLEVVVTRDAHEQL